MIHITLLNIAALQIGFQLPQYDFLEPNQSAVIFDVQLTNRQSEQTYNVSIIFGEPGSGIRAATQHVANRNDSDYDIGSLENEVLTLSSLEPSMTIPFTLLPDDIVEGIEGFRIAIAITSMFPMNNEPPVTDFASTLIRILDDDCEY